MPNDSRTNWTRRALLAAVLAATAGGCTYRSRSATSPQATAHQEPSYAETPSPAPVPQPMPQPEVASPTATGQACPEPLAQLEIRSIDTPAGIALVFSTPAAEDVDALRGAVHRMTGEPSASGAPSGSAVSGPMPGPDRPPGAHAGTEGLSHDASAPGDARLDMVGTVAVDAKVVDTPDGARIELTPKNSTELESLRGEVRQQVTAMQVALCPDEVSLLR